MEEGKAAGMLDRCPRSQFFCKRTVHGCRGPLHDKAAPSGVARLPVIIRIRVVDHLLRREANAGGDACGERVEDARAEALEGVGRDGNWKEVNKEANVGTRQRRLGKSTVEWRGRMQNK